MTGHRVSDVHSESADGTGEDVRLREALESIATARQEADDFDHPDFDWRLLAGRMEDIARRALADA